MVAEVAAVDMAAVAAADTVGTAVAVVDTAGIAAAAGMIVAYFG